MARRSHAAMLSNAREPAPGFCDGDAAVGGRETAVGVAELERQPDPFTRGSGEVGTSRVLAEIVGH